MLNLLKKDRTYTELRNLTIIVEVIILVGCLIFLPVVWGEETYTDDELADAIYLAEGGKNTKYPYGIRSVKCEGKDECRQVCLNTVRNNRKRYADYGYKTHKSYLEFLANRYSPIDADNDPKGLNKNWLKNVLWFLTKGVRG